MSEEPNQPADAGEIPKQQQMEVHHPHVHGNKKWKDYVSEFVMIFLAVTAGFFAETLREHISDSKKEKEYMVSMLADLREDTARITEITRSLFKNIRGQDSLILLLKDFHPTDSLNSLAYRYYLRYTIGVPQVLFNEGTITQLIGSGNMRLVEDRTTADSITDYINYVKVSQAQAGYYNDQFKKCFDYSTNIFDFTVARNPLREDMTRMITGRISLDHLQLLSHDSLQLKKYCNELTMLQSIINGYIANLYYTKKRAASLSALLIKRYKIEEK